MAIAAAMTEFDHQRIANGIGDAFAILCVRASGGSAAERHVRLGFEAILRQLGTPPLRFIARYVPPPGRAIVASAADWRHILHSLDRCRAVFARYDGLLTAAQRRTRALLETTRTFAEAELRSRSQRSKSAETTTGATGEVLLGRLSGVTVNAGAA